MVVVPASIFVTSVGFGFVSAAVLALAAVGFTLQFAVTNVLNLAYGGVMIVSAYAAYVLNNAGVNIWIATLAAIAAGALLSVFLNNVVYTPFQRRGSSPIAMVIVSLGMTLILEFGTQALAGATNVSYSMSQGATVSVASIQLTVVQLVIIGLSVAVMLLVHALIRYSKMGKAMRATAANRNLARNCGIRTGRVVMLTWLISGALCGLAGATFAMNSGTFGATSTDLFLVLILAAVFLGGPGEPYGAMLGALVIGLATEVSAAVVVSDYKDVVAFVILLVMLALRPTGLLGTVAEAGRA
jgi:branched-chain amino acid transport system permease protein/neutral amino acid transport system permease protein